MPRGESGDESHTVKGRTRTKQETCSRAGRAKTWPEKRRERREVKRLKREAQARRGDGLLGRAWGEIVDEVRTSRRGLATVPPLVKKGDGEGAGKSRRSRESEKYMKRRQIKHSDLHPYGERISKYMSFLEKRVRHRKR